ncbi:hypothetical protein CP8484711_1834, partial [Chlamydia psittaci 84-8471/1]
MLSDSSHLILTMERKDHYKTTIEKDPFHNDVVAD